MIARQESSLGGQRTKIPSSTSCGMILGGGCAPQLTLGGLKQRASRPRISLIKRKKARRPTARLAPPVGGCVFSPPSTITTVGLEHGIGLAVFSLARIPPPSYISLSYSFIPRRKKHQRFQDTWGTRLEELATARSTWARASVLPHSSLHVNCCILSKVISRDKRYTSSFGDLMSLNVCIFN